MITRASVSSFFEDDVEERAGQVVFDFSGIEFIGRAAAHQWLMEEEKRPEVEFKRINLNENLTQMFEVVTRTRFSSQKLELDIPVVYTHSLEELRKVLVGDD